MILLDLYKKFPLESLEKWAYTNAPPLNTHVARNYILCLFIWLLISQQKSQIFQQYVDNNAELLIAVEFCQSRLTTKHNNC